MHKVLMVSDCPLFNIGMATALGAAGIETIESTETGLEAITTSVRENSPDVVILDGEGSWMTVSEALQGTTKVLVLLGPKFPRHNISQVLRLGVSLAGRNRLPEVFPDIVKKVRDGRLWIDEEIIPSLSTSSQTDITRLTPREEQIVALVREGYKNKEIGKELGITAGTVKVHLGHVFEKLDIHGRYELLLQNGEQSQTNVG